MQGIGIDFKDFFIDTFFGAVYELARVLKDAWTDIPIAWFDRVPGGTVNSIGWSTSEALLTGLGRFGLRPTASTTRIAHSAVDIVTAR